MHEVPGRSWAFRAATSITALVTVALAAPVALGATVTVDDAGVTKFRASAGETNTLDVAQAAEGWTFTDGTAAITANLGCILLTPATATCTSSYLPLRVRLGDGDDSVRAPVVSGDPRFFAGAGDDYVFVTGFESAIAHGGAGNDEISFYGDVVTGGSGDDDMLIRGSLVTASGGAGADAMTYRASGRNFGAPTLNGDGGDDTITAVQPGGSGQFGDGLVHGTLNGEAGDDHITVLPPESGLPYPGSHFTITGGAGSDTIVGGVAPDAVDAGPGADTVDVRGPGPDSVVCGAGKDSVRADADDTIAADCERVAIT
jgi:hypothetical protein